MFYFLVPITSQSQTIRITLWFANSAIEVGLTASSQPSFTQCQE